MAEVDPHTWLHIVSTSPQLKTIDYAWCRDCGALKTRTITGRGETIEIRTPTEYHTCGTNKSKQPART